MFQLIIPCTFSCLRVYMYEPIQQLLWGAIMGCVYVLGINLYMLLSYLLVDELG